VRQIAHIWHEAWSNRLPLNVLISVRPEGVDAMTIHAKRKLYRRIVGNYREHARRNGYVAAYIEVVETLVGDTHENLHIACHVPTKLRAAFIERAFGWLPNAAEIDARPCTRHVQWLKNGKSKSTLGYIIKNMTPQAAFKSPYLRKRGGGVWGRRWNCSHNLKRFLWYPDAS